MSVKPCECNTVRIRRICGIYIFETVMWQDGLVYFAGTVASLSQRSSTGSPQRSLWGTVMWWITPCRPCISWGTWVHLEGKTVNTKTPFLFRSTQCCPDLLSMYLSSQVGPEREWMFVINHKNRRQWNSRCQTWLQQRQRPLQASSLKT